MGVVECLLLATLVVPVLITLGLHLDTLTTSDLRYDGLTGRCLHLLDAKVVEIAGLKKGLAVAMKTDAATALLLVTETDRAHGTDRLVAMENLSANAVVAMGRDRGGLVVVTAM